MNRDHTNKPVFCRSDFLSRTKYNALLAVLLLTSFPAVNAEELAPQLHIDPFKRPDNITGQPQNEPAKTDQAGAEPAQIMRRWQPQLRAVSRSSSHNGIANIGGEMVAVGEEIEGYRLIELRERSVVFKKNGKTYHITMDEDA